MTNEVQHRIARRHPRLTYRPVGDQSLINLAATVLISMIMGALLLAIVEVTAINLAR